MMHVQKLDRDISTAELLISVCKREKDKSNGLQNCILFFKNGVKSLRVIANMEKMSVHQSNEFSAQQSHVQNCLITGISRSCLYLYWAEGFTISLEVNWQVSHVTLSKLANIPVNVLLDISYPRK